MEGSSVEGRPEIDNLGIGVTKNSGLENDHAKRLILGWGELEGDFVALIDLFSFLTCECKHRGLGKLLYLPHFFFERVRLANVVNPYA